MIVKPAKPGYVDELDAITRIIAEENNIYTSLYKGFPSHFMFSTSIILVYYSAGVFAH